MNLFYDAILIGTLSKSALSVALVMKKLTMINNTSNHIKCEIKIKDRLGEHWQEWFEGLTFTHEIDGTTTLSGHLPDQGALHSILLKIRDLNLSLISVTQSESDKEN